MPHGFSAPSGVFTLLRQFFCFNGFCKVVFAGRVFVARMFHGLFAAMGDAFLLGMNVGVKAGWLAGHGLFSEVAKRVVDDLAMRHASQPTRKTL